MIYKYNYSDLAPPSKAHMTSFLVRFAPPSFASNDENVPFFRLRAVNANKANSRTSVVWYVNAAKKADQTLAFGLSPTQFARLGVSTSAAASGKVVQTSEQVTLQWFDSRLASTLPSSLDKLGLVSNVVLVSQAAAQGGGSASAATRTSVVCGQPYCIASFSSSLNKYEYMVVTATNSVQPLSFSSTEASLFVFEQAGPAHEFLCRNTSLAGWQCLPQTEGSGTTNAVCTTCCVDQTQTTVAPEPSAWKHDLLLTAIIFLILLIVGMCVGVVKSISACTTPSSEPVQPLHAEKVSQANQTTQPPANFVVASDTDHSQTADSPQNQGENKHQATTLEQIQIQLEKATAEKTAIETKLYTLESKKRSQNDLSKQKDFEELNKKFQEKEKSQKEQIASKSNELNQCQEQTSNLQNELENLRILQAAENLAKDKQYALLKKKFQQLQERQKKAQTNLTQKQQELETLKSGQATQNDQEIHKLRAELQKAQQNLSEITKEKDDAKTEFETNLKTLESEKTAQTNARIQELTFNLERIQEQEQGFKARLAEQQQRLAEMQEKHETQLNAEKKKLQIFRDEETNRLQTLNKKINQVQQEMIKANKMKEQQTAELSLLQDELIQREEKEAKYQEEAKTQAETQANLTAQLEQKNAEIEELKRKQATTIKACNEKLTKQSKKTTKRQQEFEKLQTENKNLKQITIPQLNQQIREEKQKLQEELQEELQTKLTKLKKTHGLNLRELEAAHNQKLQEVQEKADNAKEALKNKMENCKSSKKTLETELKTQKLAKTAVEKVLKTENKNLREALEKQKKEMTSTRINTSSTEFEPFGKLFVISKTDSKTGSGAVVRIFYVNKNAGQQCSIEAADPTQIPASTEIRNPVSIACSFYHVFVLDDDGAQTKSVHVLKLDGKISDRSGVGIDAKYTLLKIAVPQDGERFVVLAQETQNVYVILSYVFAENTLKYQLEDIITRVVSKQGSLSNTYDYFLTLIDVALMRTPLRHEYKVLYVAKSDSPVAEFSLTKKIQRKNYLKTSILNSSPQMSLNIKSIAAEQIWEELSSDNSTEPSSKNVYVLKQEIDNSHNVCTVKTNILIPTALRAPRVAQHVHMTTFNEIIFLVYIENNTVKCKLSTDCGEHITTCQLSSQQDISSILGVAYHRTR